MKAQIKISGQISGNFTLLRALNNGNYSKGMFNSFYIKFNTIGEAKKAIASAYKKLKSEETECRITKYKDNSGMNYDASNAEILTN